MGKRKNVNRTPPGMAVPFWVVHRLDLGRHVEGTGLQIRPVLRSPDNVGVEDLGHRRWLRLGWTAHVVNDGWQCERTPDCRFLGRQTSRPATSPVARPSASSLSPVFSIRSRTIFFKLLGTTVFSRPRAHTPLPAILDEETHHPAPRSSPFALSEDRGDGRCRMRPERLAELESDARRRAVKQAACGAGRGSRGG